MRLRKHLASQKDKGLGRLQLLSIGLLQSGEPALDDGSLNAFHQSQLGKGLGRLQLLSIGLLQSGELAVAASNV